MSIPNRYQYADGIMAKAKVLGLKSEIVSTKEGAYYVRVGGKYTYLNRDTIFYGVEPDGQIGCEYGSTYSEDWKEAEQWMLTKTAIAPHLQRAIKALKGVTGAELILIVEDQLKPELKNTKTGRGIQFFGHFFCYLTGGDIPSGHRIEGSCPRNGVHEGIARWLSNKPCPIADIS